MSAMEALYPFLYSDASDLADLMAEIRESTLAKTREIAGLRRLVGGRLGPMGLSLSIVSGLLPLLLVSSFDGASPAGHQAQRQASEPSASNA